jgi:hypothetical protein|tara:strand:+ start:228 stop:458 length:231 start_codon:yes stop_codon:yes gene_type:complete
LAVLAVPPQHHIPESKRVAIGYSGHSKSSRKWAFQEKTAKTKKQIYNNIMFKVQEHPDVSQRGRNDIEIIVSNSSA